MKMTPEQKAFYDFGVTWGGASVFTPMFVVY